MRRGGPVARRCSGPGMNRAKLLCAYLVACLSALLLAAPAVATEPVAAPRTISNIATIGWDAGGQRVELPSNRVDLEVTTPSTSVTLQTYKLPDGEIPPALLSATCVAAGQPPAASPEGGSTPPPLSSYDLIATGEIVAGHHVVLALDRASANHDSQAIETLHIYVRTSTGDREEVTLVETSANSGRFVGIILTTTGPPVPGDCRLSVHADEALTIIIADTPDGAPLVQAEIRILVDPFGIAFDSRDGRRSPRSGSPWSTPIPERRRSSSATTAFRAIRRRWSPARASPTAAAPATISRRATIVSRWFGRAATGCSSEPLASLYRAIGRDAGRARAAQTARRPAVHHRRRLLWRRDPPRRRRAVRIDIPLDRPMTPIILAENRLPRRSRSRRSGAISAGRSAIPTRPKRHRRPDCNRSYPEPDAVANRIGSCRWRPARRIRMFWRRAPLRFTLAVDRGGRRDGRDLHARGPPRRAARRRAQPRPGRPARSATSATSPTRSSASAATTSATG